MTRRTRHVREHSFRSFRNHLGSLGVVLLLLLMTVWMVVRAPANLPASPRVDPALPAAADAEDHEGALGARVTDHRQKLEELQAVLERQKHEQEQGRVRETQLQGQLEVLQEQLDKRGQEQIELEHRLQDQKELTLALTASSTGLKQREAEIQTAITAAARPKVVNREVHYDPPEGQSGRAPEVGFECRGGRVTALDLVSLATKVRVKVESGAANLHAGDRYSDVTEPVGAFRIHFTVEMAPPLDPLAAMTPGPPRPAVPYRLTRWTAEAVTSKRGETLEAALADNSVYRQTLARLTPGQTPEVLFWVYPDSFALYRRLRDDVRGRKVTGIVSPMEEPSQIGSR